VSVPVGATAAVHLPGGAEAEVGHGDHEWTLPYAEAPALPAQPSIRQLMDHQPSWDRVVAAAGEAGVAAGEAELAARLERFLDASAGRLVDAATSGGFVPGADALRALLAEDQTDHPDTPEVSR
jgi:alpha-L-rhamnosidase